MNIKAPHIKEYDTQDAIDDFFTRHLLHWSRKFPDEFTAIIRHVSEMRRGLDKENAMSKGGTMMWKGCYPSRLANMLTANYYKFCPENGYKITLPHNWMDSEKYFGRFMQVFKCFAVNVSSQPNFDSLKDRAELEDDFPYKEADAEGFDCSTQYDRQGL
jgi:hypothetical protein